MYNLVNLSQIIDAGGENSAALLLSTFSSKNHDVQAFIRNNAIDFAVRRIAVTYLVVSDHDDIVGLFTLANKIATFPIEGLSKSQEKRLQRFATLDSTGEYYTSPAILIAQFSKNSNLKQEHSIKGSELMLIALDKIRQVQELIGGKIVWLECESDNENALAFYSSNDIDFKEFSRRESAEGTLYIQMLKWL